MYTFEDVWHCSQFCLLTYEFFCHSVIVHILSERLASTFLASYPWSSEIGLIRNKHSHRLGNYRRLFCTQVSVPCTHIASCYIVQLYGPVVGKHLGRISYAGLCGLDKFSPLLHIHHFAQQSIASQKWRFVADDVAGSRSYAGKVFPEACWEANRELSVSVDKRQCFRKLQSTSVCTWTGRWTSNNPWRCCSQGYIYWVSLMRA